MGPDGLPLAGIHVRAAHNGKQTAFLLEWDAPEPSHAAVGQQQFRDGAAVQLSLTGAYTFLGMGDQANPVNVWHWKSDWQAEVNGQREDINTRDAAGFGTLEAQPAASQNVAGKGVWQNGQWRVLFVRDLASKDNNDEPFSAGNNPIPVSFAVWAGEHGDRNGQKAVSTWFNLKLER